MSALGDLLESRGHFRGVCFCGRGLTHLEVAWSVAAGPWVPSNWGREDSLVASPTLVSRRPLRAASLGYKAAEVEDTVWF